MFALAVDPPSSSNALFAPEMAMMRKQAELDKKSYDDLVRERDVLSKVGLPSTMFFVSTSPSYQLLPYHHSRTFARLQAPQTR